MDRRTVTLLIFSLVLPAGILAACEHNREEGHINATILRLNTNDATKLETEISREGTTYLVENDVYPGVTSQLGFTGHRAGMYSLTSVAKDSSGKAVQKGITHTFDVVDDEIANVRMVMFSLDQEPCVKGLRICDGVYDVILECTEGQGFEPVIACAPGEDCLESQCVAGTSQEDDLCIDGTVGGEELLVTVCDPNSQDEFTAQIDHTFFPPVGSKYLYSGLDDSVFTNVELSVLEDTESIIPLPGEGSWQIEARVVQVRETEGEDNSLTQLALKYFAQSLDGTVCFLGEEVTKYEDGVEIGTAGTWHAGSEGALPGIFLPKLNDLVEGNSFQQQLAPGVALDRGRIARMGKAVTVAGETYPDTMEIKETSPLDSDTSTKIYARNVGMITDDDLKLVENRNR